MPETIGYTNFVSLFKNQASFLDVRAPIEFEQGSIPGSVNLPLLNDHQREAVGKTYRKYGKDEAIYLGQRLISGNAKKSRLFEWTKFCENHKNPTIFCHRGGLRSKIVQNWLYEEEGIEVPRISGGYKALRLFAIDALEKIPATPNLLIIGGKTGTAKTQIINGLPHAIDLEGLANHRGSAFGNRIEPQPSQASFENKIAYQYILNGLAEQAKFFMEDESRMIGSLNIPLPLYDFMRTSPIALINSKLEERIETILNDYIISNYKEYASRSEENNASIFSRYLLSSLDKIRKRLGDQNYEVIKQKMHQASYYEISDTFREIHREWIQILIQKYYDPMYEYQLRKKEDRIIFEGTRKEFCEWIQK